MYEDRVNTNFQGKKVPKENASYKCLVLVVLEKIIKNTIHKHFCKSVNM